MKAILIGLLVPITLFAILALVVWFKSSPRTRTPAVESRTWKIPETIGAAITIIAIAFMAVVAVSGIVKGVKWCLTPPPRPTPIWRDIEVFHLVPGKPVTIPWPKGAPRDGTDFKNRLAPYEDQSKRYWVKSGDRNFNFGAETQYVKIYGEQDVILTTKDREVYVTWQWYY